MLMVNTVSYSGKNREMKEKIDRFKHNTSQMFPIS